VSALTNRVCNGRGKCTSRDVCTCEKGYGGPTCNIPECYDFSAANVSVCSGNGKCSSPDKCACKSGYRGEKCQLYSCFGVNSENETVCSGNGKCISPEKCECDHRYYGSRCSDYQCFGIDSTNSSVCGGLGQCIAANLCQCEPMRGGKTCEKVVRISVEGVFPAEGSYGDSIMVIGENFVQIRTNISCKFTAVHKDMPMKTYYARPTLVADDHCVCPVNFETLNEARVYMNIIIHEKIDSSRGESFFVFVGLPVTELVVSLPKGMTSTHGMLIVIIPSCLGVLSILVAGIIRRRKQITAVRSQTPMDVDVSEFADAATILFQQPRKECK
jgi:hypothetical protein